MSEPLAIAPGVVVPAEAIEWSAVRSAGPGGQNVNKVSSKVQLRVDLAQVTGLDDASRARLLALAGRRLDSEGRLIVSSQRTRDQLTNLQDARDKVRNLIAQALVAPEPRRPTQPSKTAVRRRLENKRRQGEKKQQRKLSGDD